MKKSFFMLGLALLALTSCSESEVLDVVEDSKAGPIGFSTWVGKPTRAVVTDNTVEVLKGDSDGKTGGFVVHGGYKADAPGSRYVPVFDGTESTSSLVRYYKGQSTTQGSTDGTTQTQQEGSWQYNTVYYWEPNTKYRFAAYAPLINKNLFDGGGSVSFNYDANQLSITNFKADGQTDLVVAASCSDGAFIDADNQITTNNAIAMDFKHALAKVCFTFINGWHNAVTVTVNNIRLSGVKTTGTLNTNSNLDGSGVKMEDWTPAASTATTTLGLDGSDYVDENSYSQTTTNAAVCHFENYLIPQELETTSSSNTTNIELQFTVTIAYKNAAAGPTGPDLGNGSNTKTLKAKIPVDAVKRWVPGYLYQYTLEITGETFGLNPIKFTIDEETGVTPWGKGTSPNWDIDGTKSNV